MCHAKVARLVKNLKKKKKKNTYFTFCPLLNHLEKQETNFSNNIKNEQLLRKIMKNKEGLNGGKKK